MKPKMTCFLPCRKGSQRVPRKNIKPFSIYEKGLIGVKLHQLIKSNLIDEVILSTNDVEILDYAESLKNSKIRLHHRCEALSSSDTSTDELVLHASDLISDSDILWTHVTSPFITTEIYDDIINSYYKHLKKGYDSLMTSTAVQNYLWQEGEAINYNRKKEKWPRTQTLKVIQEVNSGVFLASSKVYKLNKDRIGNSPFFYELGKLDGHDIDWPEDFLIAECLLEKKLVKL